MRHLQIADLIDLAASDVDSGEDRLFQIYTWHFDRVKTVVQWVLSAAASIFIAVLVAFFRDELVLPWWQSLTVVIFALATASYGAYRLHEVREIGRQYIAALRLYKQLRRIRMFLSKYQDSSSS